MQNLIVFDLDGVLIDSREIHFNALNLALNDIDSKYVISKSEQDSTYEGLTTRAKLEILSVKKGLPENLYDEIWKSKQSYSSVMFLKTRTDIELTLMINAIKKAGIKVAVASNSIRDTLDNCLSSLGIARLVDYTLSNEDVNNPKPDPEIYNMCMDRFGATPETTVIFEDSQVGQQAAIASGAKMVSVADRKDLTFNKIFDSIDYLNRIDRNE
jgi:beta-phosphoglucomutase-like phosphatase (HAD superfamily)